MGEDRGGANPQKVNEDEPIVEDDLIVAPAKWTENPEKQEEKLQPSGRIRAEESSKMQEKKQQTGKEQLAVDTPIKDIEFQPDGRSEGEENLTIQLFGSSL